jgi:polyribonucleotide nucleotidyltransferase
MYAGVPIKAPVTGIAMVLIKEGTIICSSDIQGAEDHLGDKDFQSREPKRIPALKWISKSRITTENRRKALDQANEGVILSWLRF